MATIKQVVILFSQLSEEDKPKCLRMLDFVAKPSNRITKFAEKHQFVYKENISFKRTPPKKGETEVEINLVTSFGKFKGVGKTVEQAKIKAIELAEMQQFEEITEKELFNNY